MLLPELFFGAIPSLSTHDISCNCNEVRLLLIDHVSDHLKGLVVSMALLLLSKVEIGKLHNLESVVGVHPQVDSV